MWECNNSLLQPRLFSSSLYAGRIPTGAFRTQPKLLSLNLTNNLVDVIDPGAFANTTRLVRLILTRNRLSEIKEGSFQGESS